MKSNDKYSFLYDPKFTMQITVNGQLLISMLAERLANIESLIMLQANTDGLTCKLKKEYEPVFTQICKDWELETGYSLEYNYYNIMAIRDVNNYIAQKTDNSVKVKGIFEIDKELHKNSSMRIVPITLREYYINNIPIETTIRNHTDIYDFCIAEKFPKPWYGEFNYLENNEKKTIIFKKNIRYYVSTKGSYLWKINKEDGRIIQLESGYSIIPFNRYIEKTMKDYNINYNYYIKEVNKIINTIDDGQLTLF